MVFTPGPVRTTVNRRRYLAALGGLAGVSGVAGCLGGPGGAIPTDSPEPTDSGDHPVTPSETTFRVTDRACGSGANRATVAQAEGVVSIDGVIGGRDTCDTAQLAEATLHQGELTVVVEVHAEEHTGTVACAQCLTDISYEFSATVGEGGPDRVRVVHRTADGEQTVVVAEPP